ncbi:MAG TPA: hypothetical protein PKV71_21370, partial [Calditrichia bacterium]|nr:hypothetical protein [Calditrichia bacterium]
MKKPLANLQFAYTLSFLALLFSTILPQENPEAENPVLKDQKPVLWAQIQADSGAWYAALAPANDPENPDSPTPDRETGDSPEIPLGDLGIGSGISL